MRIIETLIKILILCIPIWGCIIADKLSNIITIDMIMRVVYITIPIALLYLISNWRKEGK